jgi:hypothetical protein
MEMTNHSSAARTCNVNAHANTALILSHPYCTITRTGATVLTVVGSSSSSSSDVIHVPTETSAAVATAIAVIAALMASDSRCWVA